jgi:murein DD-endopeptidase MepM/ murein hydrolase activator NlpD
MKNFMRKGVLYKMTAVALGAVLAVSQCVLVSNRTTEVFGITQDEIDDTKSQAESIKNQLQEVKNQISSLKAQANTTKESINKYDTAISTLDAQLYALNDNIEKIEANIQSTQESLEAAQADVNSQYEMMKLRIQFMYEHNTEGYLALILESESIGDLLNKAEYISQISSYDRDMMTRYQETVAYVEQTKQDLEDEFALLQEQKEELDTQKEEYQALAAQRESEYATLTSQLTTASNLQTQLTTNLNDLEDQVKKMEAEMAAQNPTVSGTGVFMWPTTSTRITSNYGDTEDRSSPHKGVDIGAVKIGVWGDPIYAADSGQVTIATMNATAGNWIWIYHGNGLYTVYMHCSTLLVSVGDTVTKGQQIATMGSTGNSNGAHLHFGVRLNGAYVNPWNYVSKPS